MASGFGGSNAAAAWLLLHSDSRSLIACPEVHAGSELFRNANSCSVKVCYQGPGEMGSGW